MTWSWNPSASHDVAAYIMTIALRTMGEIGPAQDFAFTAELSLADTVPVPAVGSCYIVRVEAMNYAGNRSDQT